MDRDIQIRKGNDYVHQLTFVDDNESALNVSTSTFTAYLTLDNETVATFSTDDTSEATGVIVVSLTDTQTSALTAGARYKWLVEQVDALSRVTTALVGNVTVLPALRD